jgi:hypothetical protein
LDDTVMCGEGGQDRLGRSVARADGTRLLIMLEAAVWDAIDDLCRREGLDLGSLVEAGGTVFPGESPADTLYRTVLGYWMKAAIATGLGVAPRATGGIAGSDAVLAAARRPGIPDRHPPSGNGLPAGPDGD